MSTVFWNEPKITVVAQTMRAIGLPPAGNMWQTNDTKPITSCEALPEIGGRVCYMSYGKGRRDNKDYIANILDKGHESVLEHAVISFGIEGISRSCSHEFVRHRHLSFSQLSQRYVEHPEFVYPVNLTTDKRQTFEWACKMSSEAYRSILETNDKQTARAALPNATETKMLVTGNLRSWRHFVKIRGTIHAEPEIRRLACLLFDELVKLAPNVFQDLECMDGTVRPIPAGRVDDNRTSS